MLDVILIRSAAVLCRSALLVGLLTVVAVTVGRVPAGGAEQLQFTSPEKALRALITAVKKNDQDGLLAIFGSDASDLVSSGDEVADEHARAAFVAATAKRTALEKDGDTTVIIHIGKDDASFPIPLVKTDSGWHFDTAAGKEEILNRRIGRNELHTITVCRAFFDAQRDYASRQRRGGGKAEYAPKLRSTPGKQDGLYWEVSGKEEESPIGPLLAVATSEGYSHTEGHAEPQPYHGYFFRILTAQGPHAPGGEKNYVVDGHMTGGFALVAYPAQYGASGVMTFVINQLGIVFQKDLGEKTAETAAAMTKYDPDDSWQPVKDAL